MVITEQASDATHFILKRSELNTGKLFVEFYLPEYQSLLQKLRERPYPLYSLSEISKRIFDGPFGSDRKIDMYQETGIPYMRVKDIQPEGIKFNELVYISEEKHNRFKRSCVLPGNVLITIAGRVGTAAVFPDSFSEGNITGHIVGIELSEDINPYYIATFINSYLGEFQVIRLAHRTTRPELNLSEVGQILIPIPPLNVQNTIAQVMQDAYEKKEKMIIEANNLLDSIDVYILSKLGIILDNELKTINFIISLSELKNNRFDVEAMDSNFNANYYSNISWIELHEIAYFPKKTKIPSKNPENQYFYIGMSDVDEKFGEVHIRHLLGQDIKANKIIFQGNDVIFARIEPCVYNGKVALIPTDIEEALGSTELIVARPKNNILPEFLFWILRSELIQRQIAGKMTGTTGRRRLPDAIFKFLKLPKVPLELQKIIAEEANRRKDEAKRLSKEAEKGIKEAKLLVEKMILGME